MKIEGNNLNKLTTQELGDLFLSQIQYKGGTLAKSLISDPFEDVVFISSFGIRREANEMFAVGHLFFINFV